MTGMTSTGWRGRRSGRECVAQVGEGVIYTSARVLDIRLLETILFAGLGSVGHRRSIVGLSAHDWLFIPVVSYLPHRLVRQRRCNLSPCSRTIT